MLTWLHWGTQLLGVMRHKAACHKRELCTKQQTRQVGISRKSAHDLGSCLLCSCGRLHYILE